MRGQGVGGQLLGFVCNLAVKMADEYGCTGVVADAKPGAETFYARFGIVAHEALEGQSEARPRPTLMFLAIQGDQSSTRQRPQVSEDPR